MNTTEALQAICGTGKGRCWHCDRKLPRAEVAIKKGWDVQRIFDHPVPSIILVCPTCLRRNSDSPHKESLQALARRAAGATTS
ncbi:MAG TPA: hypothetical protein VFD30_13075 [Terriglobia bacterium]|jgi:hypothetical protein|nr:hypothetical protein [Terriglobia bacterium]